MAVRAVDIDQSWGQPREEAAPTLIAVSKLNRSYASWKAVRDVSFEIRSGVTGLLGPNGAGKSSLMTCLAGIAAWDDGRIEVDGIDLARQPTAARRQIGFMPERVAFPAEMRVGEYLHFVCEVKRIARAERSRTVEAALERISLGHVRSRIIGNLSKGYRQRVGLAQAIVGDPAVLILDEPTAGLDPLNVFDIRDVLQEYARGRAVLVSTHQLPDARLMCDRVIVMSAGRVVYDGVPGGMGREPGAVVRVRLRIRRAGSEAPPPLLDGCRLVHAQSLGDEWVIVADADNEEVVGETVRALSQQRLVVGVEPTMDALEDAFKRAVLGEGEAE